MVWPIEFIARRLSNAKQAIPSSGVVGSESKKGFFDKINSKTAFSRTFCFKAAIDETIKTTLIN
jgi:hypothetical protein